MPSNARRSIISIPARRADAHGLTLSLMWPLPEPPSSSPANSRTSIRVAIISDIHYACEAEKAQRHTILDPIQPRWRRQLVYHYRYWFWLRDAFAHNHLLDRFLAENAEADLCVANGDFSCDSAYLGLMDEPAFQSATECLEKLRSVFGERLHATFGDHEIGKKMLAADVGGLRLTGYRRAQVELGLRPLWSFEVGRYVLIGITSTLVAMPVYEQEALAEEIPEWRRLHDEHMQGIRKIFSNLKPDQRVLLFCHDPTALPYLWHDETIREKLPQIERTIIGHLHSPSMLWQSRLLSGLPVINFLGHTPRRLSSALREARHWKPFKILLCPSPSGMQLFKDGGYYLAHLDPEARRPVRFTFRPLTW